MSQLPDVSAIGGKDLSFSSSLPAIPEVEALGFSGAIAILGCYGFLPAFL